MPAAAGGDDLGERHVPLLPGDGIHLLAVVGEPQGSWAELVLVPAGEGAIVVAAPHAEAVASLIEGHQRGADDVQHAVGQHLLHVELGLGDAVAVACRRISEFIQSIYEN